MLFSGIFSRRFTSLALALVFLAFPLSALAKLSLVQQVDGGVWRGSQPTAQRDFAKLKEMGIKVIINIQRIDDSKVKVERKAAEESGFKFIHIPIDARARPDDGTIAQVFKELRKKSNQPVYLHCTLGRDRTGLVFALYRVKFQGLSPEEAYEEWTGLGFSGRFLKELDHYFKEKTGFKDTHDKKEKRRARQCDDRLT